MGEDNEDRSMFTDDCVVDGVVDDIVAYWRVKESVKWVKW